MYCFLLDLLEWTQKRQFFLKKFVFLKMNALLCDGFLKKFNVLQFRI